MEKLLKIAEELGTNMSVLALSWILRKSIISSVITGASKPSQLENNLAAADFKFLLTHFEDIEKYSILRDLKDILVNNCRHQDKLFNAEIK